MLACWETISPDGHTGHRTHIQVYFEVLGFDVLVVSANYRASHEPCSIRGFTSSSEEDSDDGYRSV